MIVYDWLICLINDWVIENFSFLKIFLKYMMINLLIRIKLYFFFFLKSNVIIKKGNVKIIIFWIIRKKIYCGLN